MDRRIYVLLATLLLAVAGFLSHGSGPKDEKTAVIVNQLEGLDGGGRFIESALELLEASGYGVRVFRGEEVTLGLMLEGVWDARIVVLRMHSGVFDGETWLFTHERYSNRRYVVEQLLGLVNIGQCRGVDYPVFTFSPRFLSEATGFKGVVILMGCNTMELGDLPRVLVEGGCEAVVGFEGPVTIEEADQATQVLLGRLLEGLELGDSVDGLGFQVFPAERSHFKLG